MTRLQAHGSGRRSQMSDSQYGKCSLDESGTDTLGDTDARHERHDTRQAEGVPDQGSGPVVGAASGDERSAVPVPAVQPVALRQRVLDDAQPELPGDDADAGRVDRTYGLRSRVPAPRVWNHYKPEDHAWLWFCTACEWRHEVPLRELESGSNVALHDNIGREHLETAHG